MENSELSLGAMSASVRQLHADLAQRRFHVPREEVARGYFGPGTRQALMQFQRHAGLALTGVADARTTLALGIQSNALPVEDAPPEDAAPPEQPINQTCPWSGRPVDPDSLLTHQERVVGFCSPAHRDRFALAIQHFADQQGLPLERKTCPWSGKRVRSDATLIYDGETVGFCSLLHRDQFQTALAHFASPGSSTTQMGTATDAVTPSTDAMMGMEHPQNSTSVPPLVAPRIALNFERAVQSYADGIGQHGEVERSLRALRARLENLRLLALLSRFAVLGYPHAVSRLRDELECIVVDFDEGPLEDLSYGYPELHEDEPDTRVTWAAVIDLLAGASFAAKDDNARRDRYIVGVVRAVEDAISFPVACASEASTYLDGGTAAQSVTFATTVIANAKQRLLEGDRRCRPRVPAELRLALYRLANHWMEKNPVTQFLECISGPRVHHIVRWEDPRNQRPDDAQPGDRVTVLVHQDCGENSEARRLSELGVMFCPHQPAPVVRTVDDGLQVLIPELARTGPVAVIVKAPDFSGVQPTLQAYAGKYVLSWALSIFGYSRIDTWAYPYAFSPPILEIGASKPREQDAGLKSEPASSAVDAVDAVGMRSK